MRSIGVAAQKKFDFFSKKGLQKRRGYGRISDGCKGLVRYKSCRPRYALMREVVARLGRCGLFPRSMSDLRTGRKNY